MAAAALMFDPKTYDLVRKPVTQAATLPAWCYTSEDYYRAEVKHLFMKVWNFIGRADRIPDVGDYFTLDFVGVPLIIVRDRDGTVKAFSNTCRHRGARLVPGEMIHTKQNTRGFKCPYHAWVYGIDGALKGCPGMENTEGFDKGEHGLVQVRLETWGGFMFINFDPGAQPLLEYLGDMPEVLQAYRTEELVLTRQYVHDVACNWKVHIENAMEDYHVATVHGTTLNKLAVDHRPVPTKGAWFNMREKHASKTRALLEEDRAHALPFIKGLTGHAAEGTNFVCINPSTTLALTLDCVWYIELHPMGPHRTRVVVGSCFPKDTVALPDFNERVKYYYKRWDKSIGEDNEIAETQQRGLISPLSRPGRMSDQEYLIPLLAQWWVSHTVDRGAALERAA